MSYGCGCHWKPWRAGSPCWCPRLWQWLIPPLIIPSHNNSATCYLPATRNEVKLLKENSCVPSQNGSIFYLFLAIFRESNRLSHWLTAPGCSRLCPALPWGRGSGASSSCSKLMPKRFLSSRKAATLEQEHFQDLITTICSNAVLWLFWEWFFTDVFTHSKVKLK